VRDDAHADPAVLRSICLRCPFGALLSDSDQVTMNR